MNTQFQLDPEDLFALAQELAQRKDSAAVRSACDRAYYAAFLFTRNRLASLNKVHLVDGAGDHKGVSEALKRVQLTRGIELWRLYTQRGYYTYRTETLDASVHPPTWMLQTAQDIITYVKTLR